MPTLSSKPKVSKFQVGETVFFLYLGMIVSDIIKEVETKVSNPLNDANGIQENIYFFSDEYPGAVNESDVFATKNLLYKKLKGSYVADLSGFYFSAGTLAGKDFSGFNLQNCDFSESSNSVADGWDIRGANLTGVLYPDNWDTKEALISAVGEGFYDDDTIWVDGTKLTDD